MFQNIIHIAWSTLLIIFSGFLIWRATDGFELASNYLGRNMKKGIKGATINAIASSMPEFLATMFFLFVIKDANGFSGGVGITGGSAVFNIVVIPSCIYFVLLFTRKIKKIPINRKTFLRDGIFLLVLTAAVAVILHTKTLTFVHGLLLTLPYFVYLLYLFNQFKKKGETKKENFDYIPTSKTITIKDIIYVDLEKIVLKGNGIYTTNSWFLLLSSTAVMIVGTWLLVAGTDKLGSALNIPLIFISVILAAAASSIPDTLISVLDAKKGNYEDAFSNALGSNIFDISFALGFPLLLYTIFFSPIQMDQAVIDASTDIWFMLFIITLLTLIVFSTGKFFTLKKALFLLFLYVLFTIFIVVEIKFDIDLTGYLWSWYKMLF
jgi:Ca2+/Na+ antiporter